MNPFLFAVLIVKLFYFFLLEFIILYLKTSKSEYPNPILFIVLQKLFFPSIKPFDNLLWVIGLIIKELVISFIQDLYVSAVFLNSFKLNSNFFTLSHHSNKSFLAVSNEDNLDIL